jgi:hypothetical protein
MVTLKDFVKLALSFPDASEQPHFHLRSFRYGKRIFSTLWEKENKAMIKLPAIEQSVFCAFDERVFYPVPGAWGKAGATFVNLANVRKDMLRDALSVAYGVLTVAKPKIPTPKKKVKKSR